MQSRHKTLDLVGGRGSTKVNSTRRIDTESMIRPTVVPCTMRRMSIRMQVQFSTIHRAAYLVRRRPDADGPVSTDHALHRTRTYALCTPVSWHH